MDIIEDKDTKVTIIVEKIWNVYLRFFFWKMYKTYLEKNWKTPKDIYNEQAKEFIKNILSDTYVFFTDSKENEKIIDYLIRNWYQNLDKAKIYATNDYKFYVYEKFLHKEE